MSTAVASFTFVTTTFNPADAFESVSVCAIVKPSMLSFVAGTLEVITTASAVVLAAPILIPSAASSVMSTSPPDISRSPSARTTSPAVTVIAVVSSADPVKTVSAVSVAI